MTRFVFRLFLLVNCFEDFSVTARFMVALRMRNFHGGADN